MMVRSGCCSVLVDDPAQHSTAQDRGILVHDAQEMVIVIGCPLGARLMGPMTVVVAGVFGQDDVRVSLAEDQNPVGALAAEGRNPPLGDRPAGAG
jgi:hypothetical protein